MAPVRVGVIGYGLSAKVFHIPLILALPELYELGAIVQRNPTSASDCRIDHPGVKHYTSATDICADSSLSLIVVTTAPSSHQEIASQALNAGKHVIVEKPFTPTTAEADALIKLASEKSLTLTAYQNRRWDADYLLVRKLISEKTLGRVVEFESHFDRHRPDTPAQTWKSAPAPGNGAIYDLGAHMIDQSLQLFGAPKKVSAFIHSQRRGSPEPADSCNVLLHYDDSLTVTLKAGVVSCEQEQLRFWVRGEQGSVWVGGTDVQEEQLRAGIKPGDEIFARGYQGGWITTIVDGKPKKEKCEVQGQGVDYRDFYRGLAGALQGSGKPPVEAEQARDVIKVIELAMKSSAEGRTLDWS